ncbi:MAG: hypothetical protein K6B52_00820 [Clostridiales bacterium]|nr:hypothetical protein [Clostridiales bacterium]
MFYYGLVTVAVVMFSFMFFFNERYQKANGTSTRTVIRFNIEANAVGLVILLIINKFRFEFTPFSLAVALAAAADALLFVFCSIKAFDKINLSLYSVISMLGGMALPFAAGIIFWGEELSAGKIVCFVLIAVSLFLTVKKDGKGSGILYYAGIFILNGMSGVISKFYTESDYPKAGDAGYSAQIALLCIAICSVWLLLNKDPKQKFSIKSLAYSSGYGILARIGNYLSLIGLSHLPASVQCPFITGGVMIVSTIICFFTPNKPGKKEIAAVALSFAGTVALVVL